MLLDILNSPLYCDDSPYQVHAQLLDKKCYLGSVSTMYRILKIHGLSTYRGRAKKAEIRTARIETVATCPNQVWCWDITNLPIMNSRGHLKMYLFQDLYSRKIVGQTISEQEDEVTASQLFDRCLKSETITGQGLRIHSDNGNPMRGWSFVDKLKNLGVIPSRSRSHVSNDNAFVESLFKTMKYRSNYPFRPFRSIAEATSWTKKFVTWYNSEHLHSGISYVTPLQRHNGQEMNVIKTRNQTLTMAYEKNPERWASQPRQWRVSPAVELNSRGCRAV